MLSVKYQTAAAELDLSLCIKVQSLDDQVWGAFDLCFTQGAQNISVLQRSWSFLLSAQFIPGFIPGQLAKFLPYMSSNMNCWSLKGNVKYKKIWKRNMLVRLNWDTLWRQQRAQAIFVFGEEKGCLWIHYMHFVCIVYPTVGIQIFHDKENIRESDFVWDSALCLLSPWCLFKEGLNTVPDVTFHIVLTVCTSCIYSILRHLKYRFFFSVPCIG